jgi:restriction system protein
MDWGDFEHLIRELFEKEFASPGGDVKITQASSDGGVDAVAFDPDPITGGKIVIQAKRYTRTVGVSAVRDGAARRRISGDFDFDRRLRAGCAPVPDR